MRAALILLFVSSGLAFGQSPTISCVGTPGNTTGVYQQQCNASTGATYACGARSGCTVASDWGVSTALDFNTQVKNRVAAGLTYTAPGAGAVARTAQGKLGDMVSVMDYGATGDGTTDDTAAIQAAMVAGTHVVIPPTASGYKITSPLKCRANQWVEGAGQIGAATINNSANSDAFQCTNNTSVCATGDCGRFIKITNLRIHDTASSRTQGAGLNLNGTTVSSSEFTLEDVYVDGHWDCVDMASTIITTLRHVNCASPANDGLSIPNGGLVAGYVNTSGTSVTWASGSTFITDPDVISWVGAPIVINGVTYYVSSVASSTALVLTATAGTQSNVTYSVSPIGTSTSTTFLNTYVDGASRDSYHVQGTASEAMNWIGTASDLPGRDCYHIGDNPNPGSAAGSSDITFISLGCEAPGQGVRGTVNTSGTAVTWVSGTHFMTGVDSASWVGQTITINSSSYTVSSVTSSTALVLTSSAGTHTGVSYVGPAIGNGFYQALGFNTSIVEPYINYLLNGNGFEFAGTNLVNIIGGTAQYDSGSPTSGYYYIQTEPSASGVGPEFINWQGSRWQGVNTISRPWFCDVYNGSGTVTSSGTEVAGGWAVARATGSYFSVPPLATMVGETITIAGSPYTVGSVVDYGDITVTTNPTLNSSPVNFSFSSCKGGATSGTIGSRLYGNNFTYNGTAPLGTQLTSIMAATITIGTVYQAPNVPITVRSSISGTGTVTALAAPTPNPYSYPVATVTPGTSGGTSEISFDVPANWYYEISQTSGTNTVVSSSIAQ